jgi:hypothetical protein
MKFRNIAGTVAIALALASCGGAAKQANVR